MLTLLFDREHRSPYFSTEAVRKSVDSHHRMPRAVLERDESLLQKLIEEHIRPL